jgi:hypothetical protein
MLLQIGLVLLLCFCSHSSGNGGGSQQALPGDRDHRLAGRCLVALKRPKLIWAQISAMKAETPHQKTTLPFVHPIRRTERNPTRPLPPIPSLLVPPARQSLWGSGGWAPSRSQPGRHEPGQFMCRYPLFSPELYELDGMKSQPIYHGLSAGSSVLYCYFLSSVTLLCSYSLRYIKT